MTSGIGLLTLITVVPLIGSVVVALLPRGRDTLAKQVALGFAVATLLLVGVAAAQYDPSDAGEGGFQMVESVSWIPALGVSWTLGLDGYGLILIVLAALLVPIVILAAWHELEDSVAAGGHPIGQVKGYFALMLVMEAMMMGVFLALDVFLFYVLFEAILIPVYFMIGRYGTGNRSYAAVKFLIYSLVGGLLMLASLAGLWALSVQAGGADFSLVGLTALDIDPALQNWLFLGFFIAFAIKAPMWPVHTWLPDAAGSSQPGTAVLLIGVLDKIGTFGMLRLCLPLFPDAAQTFGPVIIALSVVGILYGALLAIGQTDMKRMFGYISISHFGFITLGIFAFTTQGQSGATLYMLGHGISTALLFLVAGYLISRRGSSSVEDYGGVQKVAPVLSGFFLIAGLTALALPGMSTFVSEFLVLLGAFARYPWVAVVATLGIVLAALYVLLLYQRTMTGPPAAGVAGMRDLNAREIVALAPLVLIVIALGFYPAPALNVINPTVDQTMQTVGVTDPEPAVPVVEVEGATP